MKYTYRNGVMVPTESIRAAETQAQNRRALLVLVPVVVAYLLAVAVGVV